MFRGIKSLYDIFLEHLHKIWYAEITVLWYVSLELIASILQKLGLWRKVFAPGGELFQRLV